MVSSWKSYLPNIIKATQAGNVVMVWIVSLYYIAIILGLILLYGKGDFSTPGFIYQGF